MRKVSTTVYLTAEQDAVLKELHRRTRVPQADFIREGVDLMIAKYKDYLADPEAVFPLALSMPPRASMSEMTQHADAAYNLIEAQGAPDQEKPRLKLSVTPSDACGAYGAPFGRPR